MRLAGPAAGRAAVTNPTQHLKLPGSDRPWHNLPPDLPVGVQRVQEHGQLVALFGRQERRMINGPPNVIFPAEARWWRFPDTVREIGAPDGAVGIGHEGHLSARALLSAGYGSGGSLGRPVSRSAVL